MGQDRGLRTRYNGAALITGASSGIGEAFARSLAEKGFDVALVARRTERLEVLAAELQEQFSVRTLVLPYDLTDSNSYDQIVLDVAGAGWEIGVLVNNAGFGSVGILTNLQPEREEAMVDLNCRAAVALTSRFSPAMIGRRNGAILFVSSLAAYQPTPFFATYGATKTFNLIFAEALWSEFRPYGVDVLAISPGFTRTEFQQAAGVKAPENLNWASAADVVEHALARLGRTPSTVHGLANRIVSILNRVLSRKLMARLAYVIQKKSFGGSRRIYPE